MVCQYTYPFSFSWWSSPRVTLNWVASLAHLCLTNLLIGAYTLVGTAGWFSALVHHNRAHQTLRSCSGSPSDQILKVFGSRDWAQNSGQSNLSRKSMSSRSGFGLSFRGDREQALANPDRLSRSKFKEPGQALGTNKKFVLARISCLWNI